MAKWQWNLLASVVVLALLPDGKTMAETQLPDTHGQNVRLVVSRPHTNIRGVYYNQLQVESPFEEEGAPEAPLPDEAIELPNEGPVIGAPESERAPAAVPGDQSPEAVEIPGYYAPRVPPLPLATAVPTDNQLAPCMAADCQSCASSCGRASCYPCCNNYCRPCCSRICISGWIDQGVTVNGRRPFDLFNGPVTFNDRDTEYQLNQLWISAERAVNTCGYGWDIGGRVDFFYGTDWRFTQAQGLENRWNSERFYGTSMPQLYLDAAVNNLTVRMGHYFTIIGYENIPAPQNFFYSHSYAIQYGEPLTHTGLLGSYKLGDGLLVHAGFDRGWDKWEDNNNDLSFLGGLSGSSWDGRTSVAYAITTGNYDDDGQHNRTMHSIVFTRQVTDRLLYVLQHDYGVDQQGGFRRCDQTVANAEWYGINQYLLYDVDECWSLGLRIEWFRDDDGARVGGIGAPNGWTLGPDFIANQPGWAGDFWEITFGYNWKPCCNVRLRQEFRWDWYDGPVDGAGRLPYDFGTQANQFTFATDLIVTY